MVWHLAIPRCCIQPVRRVADHRVYRPRWKASQQVFGVPTDARAARVCTDVPAAPDISLSVISVQAFQFHARARLLHLQFVNVAADDTTS